MRRLEFVGTVRGTGSETMPELVVPGRDELLVAPEDWPEQVFPGALSLAISGFPNDFAAIGEGEGLAKLDQGSFRAALVIPQRKINNNPVLPDRDHPTRGFAQVWRAEVHVPDTDQTTKCWMLRIIGSDVVTQLELVAEQSLRERLGVCDGAVVNVTVREEPSHWKPPTPDEIIADWCAAARDIEMEFGPAKAMGYLVGEKLLTFLDTAETNDDWRQAIPSFVAEINVLFEPWQLAEFLNTPRRLGALGHTADDEGHRMLRESLDDSDRAREDARNLLLLEWAKELLLDESGI